MIRVIASPFPSGSKHKIVFKLEGKIMSAVVPFHCTPFQLHEIVIDKVWGKWEVVDCKLIASLKDAIDITVSIELGIIYTMHSLPQIHIFNIDGETYINVGGKLQEDEIVGGDSFGCEITNGYTKIAGYKKYLDKVNHFSRSHQKAILIAAAKHKEHEKDNSLVEIKNKVKLVSKQFDI